MQTMEIEQGHPLEASANICEEEGLDFFQTYPEIPRDETITEDQSFFSFNNAVADSPLRIKTEKDDFQIKEEKDEEQGDSENDIQIKIENEDDNILDYFCSVKTESPDLDMDKDFYLANTYEESDDEDVRIKKEIPWSIIYENKMNDINENDSGRISNGFAFNEDDDTDEEQDVYEDETETDVPLSPNNVSGNLEKESDVNGSILRRILEGDRKDIEDSNPCSATKMKYIESNESINPKVALTNIFKDNQNDVREGISRIIEKDKKDNADSYRRYSYVGINDPITPKVVLTNIFKDSQKSKMMCSMLQQDVYAKIKLFYYASPKKMSSSKYRPTTKLKYHPTTELKRYECSMCKFITFRLHNYENHMKLHSEGFNCLECEFETFDEKAMVNHLFIRHINPKYSCRKCHFKCGRREIYKEHQKLHEDIFKCQHCQFSCSRKIILDIHILNFHVVDNETNVHLLKCVDCGYEGTSNEEMRKHQREHLFKFRKHSQETLVDVHILNHHVIDNASNVHLLKCVDCGYEGTSNEEMRKHKREHLFNFRKS